MCFSTLLISKCSHPTCDNESAARETAIDICLAKTYVDKKEHPPWACSACMKHACYPSREVDYWPRKRPERKEGCSGPGVEHYVTGDAVVTRKKGWCERHAGMEKGAVEERETLEVEGGGGEAEVAKNEVEGFKGGDSKDEAPQATGPRATQGIPNVFASEIHSGQEGQDGQPSVMETKEHGANKAAMPQASEEPRDAELEASDFTNRAISADADTASYPSIETEAKANGKGEDNRVRDEVAAAAKTIDDETRVEVAVETTTNDDSTGPQPEAPAELQEPAKVEDVDEDVGAKLKDMKERMVKTLKAHKAIGQQLDQGVQVMVVDFERPAEDAPIIDDAQQTFRGGSESAAESGGECETEVECGDRGQGSSTRNLVESKEDEVVSASDSRESDNDRSQTDSSNQDKLPADSADLVGDQLIKRKVDDGIQDYARVDDDDSKFPFVERCTHYARIFNLPDRAIPGTRRLALFALYVRLQVGVSPHALAAAVVFASSHLNSSPIKSRHLRRTLGSLSGETFLWALAKLSGRPFKIWNLFSIDGKLPKYCCGHAAEKVCRAKRGPWGWSFDACFTEKQLGNEDAWKKRYFHNYVWRIGIDEKGWGQIPIPGESEKREEVLKEPGKFKRGYALMMPRGGFQ